MVRNGCVALHNPGVRAALIELPAAYVEYKKRIEVAQLNPTATGTQRALR
jgi:hypothetical protein